jgi:hypothetical protein
MITRAPRPTSNFYLLDKAISEDKRLSWAARGLLIFLLGKPDNWTVSIAALVNETAGASRSTGRDGVYAVLKELKEAGYLRIVGNRKDGGTFAGADYLVSESPHTDSPDTASPDTDLPDTASPDAANPTLISIEEETSTEKEVRIEGEKGLSAKAPPDGVSISLWTDFKKLRSAKKAAITDTAMQGIAREANKAGISLSDALTTCCERGWVGFRADWYESATPKRFEGSGSGETAYQRSMRERVAEFAPEIARKAPGQSQARDMTPMEFFDAEVKRVEK